MPSSSPPGPPGSPGSPPPPPPPPAAESAAPATGFGERSSAVLVILTAMANFVLVLLVPAVHDLSKLNRQTAQFNGTQVTSGWYFFWPGLLYVWGAAWLAFLAFAVRKNLRRALAAFLLTAALWFLPVAFFVVSLIVGA